MSVMEQLVDTNEVSNIVSQIQKNLPWRPLLHRDEFLSLFHVGIH